MPSIKTCNRLRDCITLMKERPTEARYARVLDAFLALAAPPRPPEDDPGEHDRRLFRAFPRRPCASNGLPGLRIPDRDGRIHFALFTRAADAEACRCATRPGGEPASVLLNALADDPGIESIILDPVQGRGVVLPASFLRQQIVRNKDFFGISDGDQRPPSADELHETILAELAQRAAWRKLLPVPFFAPDADLACPHRLDDILGIRNRSVCTDPYLADWIPDFVLMQRGFLLGHAAAALRHRGGHTGTAADLLADLRRETGLATEINCMVESARWLPYYDRLREDSVWCANELDWLLELSAKNDIPDASQALTDEFAARLAFNAGLALARHRCNPTSWLAP